MPVQYKTKFQKEIRRKKENVTVIKKFIQVSKW